MNALSRDQVREIDRCAIQTVGVPGAVLMENAGRNAADAIEEFLDGVEGKSVAVVAGAGNNGGDGFVISRHLAMRGARVVTLLVAPESKITGDAAGNLRILRNLGHDVRTMAEGDLAGLSSSLRGVDVAIDAVGGTGIRGALRGPVARAVEQINAAGAAVVAVDIPTGLDCDTGPAPGPTVRAALTATFVARKAGFDAPGAEAYTGVVRVVDIGIPPETVQRICRGTPEA